MRVISENSIVVTWQEPAPFDRNGLIISYMVYYNSTQWNRHYIVEVNASVINITLNNLIPFTRYDIGLKAATIIGYGPESPSQSSTTYQAGLNNSNYVVILKLEFINSSTR